MPSVKKQTPRKTRLKKTASLVDRIVPIAEWEGGGIKANFYGRNGTGKTVLACTFPKPLLLIGFEDGTKSVKRVKGVEFARVQANPSNPKVWGINEIDKLAKRAGNDFVTVVLDTVTSLQDQVLVELLGLSKIPVQSSWGAVSRDQYRQRSERTRECMRLFLDLPINVVALAQEKDHSNKEEAAGEGEVLAPFIASSLGATTCGWLHDACDYICQTFIREQTVTKSITIGKKERFQKSKTGKSEYCLRTLVHPLYACKLRIDRSVKVPEVIVDPTFSKFNQIIQQGG